MMFSNKRITVGITCQKYLSFQGEVSIPLKKLCFIVTTKDIGNLILFGMEGEQKGVLSAFPL